MSSAQSMTVKTWPAKIDTVCLLVNIPPNNCRDLCLQREVGGRFQPMTIEKPCEQDGPANTLQGHRSDSVCRPSNTMASRDRIRSG